MHTAVAVRLVQAVLQVFEDGLDLGWRSQNIARRTLSNWDRLIAASHTLMLLSLASGAVVWQIEVLPLRFILALNGRW